MPSTSFQTPLSLPTSLDVPSLSSGPPSPAQGRGECSDIESESPVILGISVNNAINQFKPRKQSGDDVYVNSNPFGPNAAQNTTQSLQAFPVRPPMMITTSTSVPPARDARRPSPSSADGGGTSGAGATRNDSGLDSNIGQKQNSSHPSSQMGVYEVWDKATDKRLQSVTVVLKTHHQPGHELLERSEKAGGIPHSLLCEYSRI